jgi:hypothetical protein
MKKAFFILGLITLFLTSLLWISSSSKGVYTMTAGEFIALLGLSIVMMVPEIIHQARRFFDAGSENVPF